MTRAALWMAFALLVTPGVAAAAEPPRAGEGATKVDEAGPAQPPVEEAAPAPGSETPAAPAPQHADPDSGMTIPSGQEGAVFRSLTVEGEDRIHFEFGRPALAFDLDPTTAPGLDWGSASDVLDRTVPDLGAALLHSSAHGATPYVAHPWIRTFQSGAVARFHPDVKGVERWKLTIVDSKGEEVAGFEGKGTPPQELAWDGRTTSGGLVVPGFTYSYVFEAQDKAGNKRNFVGQGFQVSAYRVDSVEDPVMVFSGRELPAPDPRRAAPAPGEREATAPILLEAASWLNQAPRAVVAVRVTTTARTLEQAEALGTLVAGQMTPHLIGDPARVQTVPEVQPDAPEGGVVRIAAGR